MIDKLRPGLENFVSRMERHPITLGFSRSDHQIELHAPLTTTADIQKLDLPNEDYGVLVGQGLSVVVADRKINMAIRMLDHRPLRGGDTIARRERMVTAKLLQPIIHSINANIQVGMTILSWEAVLLTNWAPATINWLSKPTNSAPSSLKE